MSIITVVGLGYVGLPVACLCASKGMKVFGLDVDNSKIEKLNNGLSPIKDDYVEEKLSKIKIIATNDSSCIKESDVVIICVPTPVDSNNIPDLTALKNSIQTVADNIKEDSLLIIESTIYPGTVEEILMPMLNTKVFVAHCPERIDPGNKKWNIENLPRVVGGVSSESADKAEEFYRSIISADIIKLNSIKAAEATKIMENTFRDVNIAFVNEMAKSFDKAGIDIIEVIKGASSKPFGFLPHYPGAGVGGHCISTDPYYLIEKAKQLGFDHKFLSLAREINNSMPGYVVELLEEEIESLNGCKVGVLGISYKKDVDDIRESPALEVIKILKEKSASVFVYDPFVKGKSNVVDINELIDKSDYLILVTDHTEFINIDVEKLKDVKIIIDGRNCLNREKIISLGIKYKGVGKK
tara:strand:+ start:359 stop:1591 length:1233 start_codon:yes stop_codon:yes gene_type:complete